MLVFFLPQTVVQTIKLVELLIDVFYVGGQHCIFDSGER
jgi:hypothetical protein